MSFPITPLVFSNSS